MLVGSLAFYSVLSITLQAGANAIAASGTEVITRICVVPAGIALDDCECGQLVATVDRWFYSESFPQEIGTGTTSISACNAPYVVGRLLYNITRCAPTPTGTAVSPTCVALDEAAKVYIMDAHNIRQSVTCKLEEMETAGDIVDYSVIEQNAVETQGMCVGSELVVLVGLMRTGI